MRNYDSSEPYTVRVEITAPDGTVHSATRQMPQSFRAHHLGWEIKAAGRAAFCALDTYERDSPVQPDPSDAPLPEDCAAHNVKLPCSFPHCRC